jgi:hypothetical protein
MWLFVFEIVDLGPQVVGTIVSATSKDCNHTSNYFFFSLDKRDKIVFAKVLELSVW